MRPRTRVRFPPPPLKAFQPFRDRDWLTAEQIRQYNEHASGRLYVLLRHQIENYLLDEQIIASVQSDIFARQTTPEAVNHRMQSIARNLTGEALRQLPAFRLNLLFRPEDFSLGQILLDKASSTKPETREKTALKPYGRKQSGRTTDATSQLGERVSGDQLDALIAAAVEELGAAVADGSDGWRTLLPGRRLLEEYARSEGLGQPIVLQNSLIRELADQQERIPQDSAALWRQSPPARSFRGRSADWPRRDVSSMTGRCSFSTAEALCVNYFKSAQRTGRSRRRRSDLRPG